MSPIPLVRARYASGFVTALQERGAPAARYLERAGLPEELLENADGLISAFSLWAFAGEAARETGIRDLGMAAGSVPVADHGEFGSKVIYAPTLYCAIETFCSEALAEYSRADFYLTRDAEMAWFCRGPIDGSPEQVQQVELYVLVLMLQTLRLALGPEWKPARLKLQNKDRRGLADSDIVRGADVEFGCSYSGIAFPLATLGHVTVAAGASANTAAGSVDNKISVTFPDDPVQALRMLLSNYMKHRLPRIEVAAEMSGLRVRTLQRRLEARGLTFTQFVDEIRFEKATDLLKDPRMSITDIAFDIGYSSLPHFTRAFRRFTGTSPREYRRRNLEVDAT
jgi:AraC-like DNA-binding protein